MKIPAKHINRCQRVIEKMRPDLAHHDLDPLPGFKIFLMHLHEAEMQPDVIEYAADHDRIGQEGHGLIFTAHLSVHEYGGEYHKHHENMDEDAPLFGFGAEEIIPDAAIEQVGEEQQADVQAGLREEAAMIVVCIVDPEADMRKICRDMYEKIGERQRPTAEVLFIRADDIEKQYQDYGAHRVAVNGCGGTPKPAERTRRKGVFDDILSDEGKAQRDYNKHYDAVLFADIGIEHHGDGEADQQKANREQRHQRVDIPYHSDRTSF